MKKVVIFFLLFSGGVSGFSQNDFFDSIRNHNNYVDSVDKLFADVSSRNTNSGFRAVFTGKHTTPVSEDTLVSYTLHTFYDYQHKNAQITEVKDNYKNYYFTLVYFIVNDQPLYVKLTRWPHKKKGIRQYGFSTEYYFKENKPYQTSEITFGYTPKYFLEQASTIVKRKVN